MAFDPSKLTASDLRTLVTVEGPTSTPNAYNESVQTWTPVVATWGCIVQLRGALLALAQARTLAATATHSVTIRYNDRIRADVRTGSSLGGGLAVAAVAGVATTRSPADAMGRASGRPSSTTPAASAGDAAATPSSRGT